jgi:hypothetical protein
MADSTELSQYVPGYMANLNLSPQQTDTKLMFGVDADLNYPEPGELFNADDVDRTDPEDVVGRVPDTPNKFIGAARRIGWFKEFQDSCWFDNVDKVKEIVDPASTKMRSLMAGRWRKVDNAVLNAGLNNAVQKVDNTDNYTNVALPGAQVIADNQTTVVHQAEEIPAANAPYGMTVGKLLYAGLLLDEGECEGDRFCAMSSYELTGLLTTTPATSEFFNEVRALVAGKLNYFCGFNIIRLASRYMFTQASLTTAGKTSRRCMAWVKPAICYRGRPITDATITRRSDKSNTPQAFYKASHAFVRRYDTGVVDIECDTAQIGG